MEELTRLLSEYIGHLKTNLATDHDLLLRIVGRIEALEHGQKEMNNKLDKVIEDHEKRIRNGEVKDTQITTYGSILVFASSFIVRLLWPKT